MAEEKPPQSPQRLYRAACPGCGAPVEFRSAASTHAVCGYCHSTVVRDGETLARSGKMAELFDDHSPLQLYASGRYQDKGFMLVGRLQYRYSGGTWSEWHVLFNDQSTGWLAEDNGAYVMALPAAQAPSVPAADQLRVGVATAIGGKLYSVASRDSVTLIAAAGELPKLPPLNQPFEVADLRSEQGVVLSVDYGSQPPAVTLGWPVELADLALTGLKEETAREVAGRQFDCPNCGASVEVRLEGSKSITCGNCKSLIDLSAGIGGELRHALQESPVLPLIELGKVGQLQGAHWQAVGFQHRTGLDPSEPDEQFGWTEYLLYNRKSGFAFLVDTEDGWSFVKPVTGAPTLAADGQSARYLGTKYKLDYRYAAETRYVLGEFYWQVQRGQKSQNQDFSASGSVLSREQTDNEVTWSLGKKIDGASVAKAFGLDDKAGNFKRDAAPVSGSSGWGCLTLFFIFFFIILLLSTLRACDDCDPNTQNCGSSARSSGGSSGGFRSGGGHK